MAEQDHAFVVGINQYTADPARYEPLRGAVNDARSFRDWALSPAGGVPPSNLSLFLSPAEGEQARAPSHEALNQEAQAIIRKKRAKPGGRLYIYNAGHGVAMKEDEPVIITCDADAISVNHFSSRKFAEYCYRSGIFSEVVLFMDCCRTPLDQSLSAEWSVSIPTPVGDLAHRRKFYFYAVSHGRRSREFQLRGVERGLFSAALIDGLCGYASTDWAGPPMRQYVTSKTLVNAVRVMIRAYERQLDADVTRQELVLLEPDVDREIVRLAPCAQARLTPVVVAVAPAQAGGQINIYRDEELIQSLPLGAAEARLELPVGEYVFTHQSIGAEGPAIPVTVFGSEPVHVQL